MSPFKKIICVVLLAAAGCFLAGSVADRAYHRYMHVFFDKLDIAFKDSTNYDVVFIGNSTVHFGIDPYYVDSVTHLNTFNLGYGGANIQSMSALFDGYLEAHPKPKAIVLSIEEATVAADDRAGYFLFFNYVQNASINHYLGHKGYHTGLVSVFPFLKYSYADEYNRSAIIKSFYNKPIQEDAIAYKGFINNMQNIFGADAGIAIDGAHLTDRSSFAALYSLVNYCKANDIKVLFVFPPRIYKINGVYTAGTNTPDTLAANTAAHFDMPYQRFDVPGSFQLNEFADENHLNSKGATHYSICTGQYIDSALRVTH
jgi:hypothetical protein